LPCPVLPLQVKGPFLKSRRQEPLPNQFKVKPTADDEKRYSPFYSYSAIEKNRPLLGLFCRMLIPSLSVKAAFLMTIDSCFTFQVNCCHKRSSKLGFTKTI